MTLGKELSWKRFIGDPKSFTLEERIFNTILIFVFITMCFEVPFNFSIGLIVPGCLCIFGLVVSALLYYLSRWRKLKGPIIVKLFLLFCNVTFTINYFFNSGIHGPNLILFSIIFLLTVAIISKKNFKVWLTINLVLVASILTVEYLYPNLVKNEYNSPLSKSLDYAVTYFVNVALIYLTISYIRKSYDDERFTVINKNISIEGQRVQLERLINEKDKLFSIVTHDIRAPLNSIQGYLEVLADAELEESERIILRQQLLQITRDTSGMLTNVLSWTKTQMEGAHAELRPLNVKDVLDSGLNIEKNISQRKGVRLEISSESDLNIIADYNMFQLVVRNLVNNAIKFTPVNGLINVVASRQEDNCSIMVKDNGLGICENQQKNLFKLNASSTYGTNNERGIGLGLLLCKEFTDLQHGKIWYEKNPEGGSIFFLFFKLKAI